MCSKLCGFALSKLCGHLKSTFVANYAGNQKSTRSPRNDFLRARIISNALHSKVTKYEMGGGLNEIIDRNSFISCTILREFLICFCVNLGREYINSYALEKIHWFLEWLPKAGCI